MSRTFTQNERELAVALMAAAIVKYKFRSPHWNEAPQAYYKALIDHVATRDLSAGWELRVGRPQAEWTAEDAAAFHDYLRTQAGPRETLKPGIQAFEILDDPGPYPVTDEGLLDLGTRGLEALCAMRRAQPQLTLTVFASVLLTTGHFLTAAVASADRLALLKRLAQEQPVFGYVLAFDGWLHVVTDKKSGHATATKLDAIMVHVGSRSVRVSKIRPYRVVGHVVDWLDPPPDIRGQELHDDPYASVFVSVPMPEGKPS